MQYIHGASNLACALSVAIWLVLHGLTLFTRWAVNHRVADGKPNKLEKPADWAGKAAIGFFVFSIVINWFLPDRPGPSEGDRCGPHQHWRWVGWPGSKDLSCEDD